MCEMYISVEFTLMRSDRKTADIVVERTGDVIVRAPKDISEDRIEQAVSNRALWIYRALAEWEDLNAKRPNRSFLQGESLMYLGRNYRLKYSPDTPKPLMLKNNRWVLSEVIMETMGIPGIQKTFRDFYIQKGESILAERVEYFAPKVGVKPGTISVRELGYHWASCGRNAALNFHWKTMLAPMTVIDYIVVHELCHLHHRNHTDVFWNEVDKVLPNYRERKEWLRSNGAALDV